MADWQTFLQHYNAPADVWAAHQQLQSLAPLDAGVAAKVAAYKAPTDQQGAMMARFNQNPYGFTPAEQTTFDTYNNQRNGLTNKLLDFQHKVAPTGSPFTRFMHGIESLPIIGDVAAGANEVFGRPGDLFNNPAKFIGKAAAGAAPFLGGEIGPWSKIMGLGGKVLANGVKNPIDLLGPAAIMAGGMMGGDTGSYLKTGGQLFNAAEHGGLDNPLSGVGSIMGMLAPYLGGDERTAVGTAGNALQTVGRAGGNGGMDITSLLGPVLGGVGQSAGLPSWESGLLSMAPGLLGAAGVGGAGGSGGNGGSGGGAGGGTFLDNLFGGGAGGSGAMDSALKAQLIASLISGGGIGGLMGAPSDKGQLGQAEKTIGGFANTGGVDMNGSTDPYALLPHEAQQLNQGVDAINAQRHSAVNESLADMIKRGLDPNTAKLAAEKLNQHFDNAITEHRTGYMENVRKNRQQTYGQLTDALRGLGGQYAGLDAIKQGNIGSMLGLAMGRGGFGATRIPGYGAPGNGSYGAGAGSNAGAVGGAIGGAIGNVFGGGSIGDTGGATGAGASSPWADQSYAPGFDPNSVFDYFGGGGGGDNFDWSSLGNSMAGMFG